MKITLIAACDKARGIGFQGQLPWHLPADLAFFKRQTLGKTILMGRKTYESIGRPLPGRRNVVITGQQLILPGIEVIHNISAMWQLQVDELMVIGGAEVYRQCLPYAEEVILTEVDTNVCADVYFPSMDENFVCARTTIHAQDEHNQFSMMFRHYVRKTSVVCGCA